jgi:transcriptional regulator with XRE-family HTH domain
MVLLRRVIGDALRARRQGQHRTLREVSTAANVSLGYLSEIERGQKEASSELLASICGALGTQLSEVLREASDTLALAEEVDGVLVPVTGDTDSEQRQPAGRSAVPTGPARAEHVEAGADRVEARADRVGAGRIGTEAARAGRVGKAASGAVRTVTDGNVSVSVHQTTPFKATLRATRAVRPPERGRPVAYAA